MTVRYYSSTAPEVTLTAGVNNVDTVIVVSSTLGFPLNTPYTLALDYGGAVEELVQVNSVAGTSLTVTRAIDGTSAASHGPGAKVRHVTSARDFKDSRDHENATSGVHGVTGNVVGDTDAQVLTNKIMRAAATNVESLLVEGIPSQTDDVIKATDGAGDTIFRVTPTGTTETGTAVVRGDSDILAPVALRVFGGHPGQQILELLDSSFAQSFIVNKDFATSFVPFDSESVDVSGASLVTAAAGWTIAGNMIATVKNGMITINGNVTRSGANITIDAAGAPSTGITAMCTIAASYRQKSTLGTMYFHGGNSIATGTLRMASSGGTIELVRWQASQTIATGNTISFTLTYPLT